MNDKGKTLEQRIKEYKKYYIYYSWRDDFPLLSIRPKEKVLVLALVTTGPYAVFEGDTLIVGTVDENTDVKTLFCAASVVKVIEGRMPLKDVLKTIKTKEYDRILFDTEYSEEEKNNKKFEARILEGIDLNEALVRWNAVKNTVTQDELDEYEQSLLDILKDRLSDYNL